MNSRERMLTSIGGGKPDYTPCSFMLFFNLRSTCPTEEARVERELEMGLDAYTHVGYLRHSLHPAARVKTWTTTENGVTVFNRRIDTPKGPLTQKLEQSEGWPADTEYRLFNDYVVPRAKEALVKPEADLEKLPYIFGPFRDQDIARLMEGAAISKRLADKHGILQIGGWNSSNSSIKGDDGVMGADAMAWLSGFVDIMTLSLTDTDLIKEYMRIIHEWNMHNIQTYLEVTGAELILRRAWYETTEFWTPMAYRAVIHPFLKREAQLVHEAGRKFGLITTSAFLPLLDDILDAGIDVLVGLDPEEGKGTDLQLVQHRFKLKRRAIWGGVSGAMTVEQGTVAETEQAVKYALETFGPDGGFILSPVDNVRENTPNAWRNTAALIETWKRLR